MPDPSPLALLVRRLESVTRLTGEEREAILGLPYAVRELRARRDIVTFGERPAHCCLVQEGWALRYTTLRQGGRQILSFYIPGDIPDLQSVYLHVMDHSLASLTPCRLALIPHGAMRELVARHPGVAAALWRNTLIDTSLYRERITTLGRRKAAGRAAHLFCELYLRLRAVAQAEDLAYRLPMTQPELADALGLTAPHLNRTLQELRRRGLIGLQDGRLVIRDWAGLAEVAEFDPTFMHLNDEAGG